jgi:TRAP-type C4-dicarboxylate transport system permease small subunit
VFAVLGTALARLERWVTGLAALAMFAVMAVVFADVIMRYVLNSPFIWSYDLVALYLLPAVFFLSLSGTYAAHAHVRVDILLSRFPEGARRLSELVTCAVGLGVFGPIAVIGWNRMADSLAGGDVLAGAIAWPTWLSDALVPLGAGLLSLRLLLDGAGHLAGLATGRPLVALEAGGPGEGMGIE